MKRSVCKHYNGTIGGQRACCDAGVNFRELVGGPDSGWLARLPCIRKPFDAAQETVPCDKWQEPTAEEIAAERAELLAAMDRVTKVDPLLGYLKKTYKGRTTQGTAKCPICGGKIRWSHSGYNGHCRLSCETENCISMME